MTPQRRKKRSTFRRKKFSTGSKVLAIHRKLMKEQVELAKKRAELGIF